MKVIFVDSNIFLRFFTKDGKEQHDQAVTLFRKAAAGKVELISGPPVLFDLAWRLRDHYHLPKDKILDVLSRIATMSGLHLLDAALVESAITIAASSKQEFADAYIHVSAQNACASEIATFNRKHFQRLGSSLFDLG
ncbi:MAG: PIN domain-containing protein [Candidatus Sumerlaeota bacterium]|nr:PIN domain-containing protein [Candidatus Sumerlaeota bacterium]